MNLRWFPEYIPIQIKMFLCLFLTVIVPLLIFIPMLHTYQNAVQDEEIVYINQERSNQTSEQLDMVYEQINAVSNLYFLDTEIEAILRTGLIYDYQQLAQDNEKIIRLQQRYDKTLPKVNLHVTIISDDNRIYGDGSYDTRNVPLSGKDRQRWYQQLLLSPWQTLWIKDDYLDRLHGVSNTRYIYSVRFLKRFDDWKNQGILIVSFLESDLAKLYANTVPKSGSVFILNRDGGLVSMIDNANVYSSGLLDRLPEGYSSTYKEKLNGVEYQIVLNTVRNPLWRTVIVTPDQQLRVQYKNTSLIPALTVLFILVVAAFSFVFSHYIVKPIEKLTKNVQQLGQSGTLSDRIEICSRDEVGVLSSEFNDMLDRIDKLMTAMVSEQEAKRNAELQSLYAQIDPHFIYNTLSSIRFLVISGDAKRADSALYDFITLLRSSISAGDELCLIQQEIDLLKRYIRIQQLFFDRPFQVIWDIAPDVRFCKIIRLTLQPIVENAILHGLKSKDGYRKLSVRIQSEGNDILITISDNGAGTDKVLNFDQVSSEYSKNIGLKNVHSRIVLHFGRPYGLQFSSAVGEGTVVTIRMPRIESQREIM
nr:sensor histidine kinase [uncultured Oscillibacter sp.]